MMAEVEIIQNVLFFLFAGILLVSAFLTVFLYDPVRNAISLIVCFLAAAGLWLLLGAEFLGWVLILVYVGAVMTLFLFVIMTLTSASTTVINFRARVGKFFFIALITVGMTVLFGYVLQRSNLATTVLLKASTTQPSLSNTEAMGHVLYTHYAWPFEITGVILLTAIIAAISLTLFDPVRGKHQKIQKQIQTQKQDRIRLVK